LLFFLFICVVPFFVLLLLVGTVRIFYFDFDF